jgi:hypothetical protein
MNDKTNARRKKLLIAAILVAIALLSYVGIIARTAIFG